MFAAINNPREIRHQLGLNQSDFWSRVGVTQSGGSRYESGRSLTRPIGTITTRDRWAVIDGDRMRMLTAQECRAAMGFPADYILPDQHRLAVHMLGNAVCPPVMRDIINAIKEAA